MSKVLFALLVIVGLINFLPVIGVVSAVRLEDAYGIELLSNDLIILMRHRALLFGILGAFIIYSAFNYFYRNAAMLMAAASMVGFIVLAYLTGGFNVNIHKIVIADYIGVALLFIAFVIKVLNDKKTA